MCLLHVVRCKGKTLVLHTTPRHMWKVREGLPKTFTTYGLKRSFVATASSFRSGADSQL